MRVRTEALVKRDIERLRGCHPDFVEVVLDVLEAMSVIGFPIFITSGVRTMAQQQALYAQGRTAPGVIVTHADGVRKQSNHQIKSDGYGHACDFAFVDDPDTPKTEIYDPGQPWSLVGHLAEVRGMRWGGRAGPSGFIDQPHLEMP